MKILKSNQDGFGAVEIILILAIITLLGVVGWLVNERSQNRKTTSNAASPSSNMNTQSSVSVIPSGWEKYSVKGVSIYHPADWKTQTEDINGTPTLSSSTTFSNKDSVTLGSLLVIKSSNGYDSVLSEAKTDKLIDSLAEKTVNGYKVISYVAYGTADKSADSRSSVKVIFIGNNEYRFTTNPSIVDESTATEVLNTVQQG